MIEAQSPMYGAYKSAQENARIAEREAVRQAIEEEKAKQDVVPRLDEIEQILKDWRAIVEQMRLLRGDFPINVTGGIVSIDPSAAGLSATSENFDCWRNGVLVVRALLVNA